MENKGKKQQGNSMPFFYKNGLSNIPQNSSKPHQGNGRKRIDKNLVLDKAKELAPISIFDLRKELNIGYGTLWNIIREFEFCGLVKTQIVVNDDNREVRMIYIPEYKEEKKEYGK